MADELGIGASLTSSMAGVDKTVTIPDLTPDVSTKEFTEGIQVITTGATGDAFALNDVTTPGWMFVKNLDATNFVQVGSGSFDSFIKLLPGEWALFRCSVATPKAVADTASCSVWYVVWDT